jgi:CDP-glycerol glycerophosphotransferase (TagB/SpsB family)
LIPAASFWIAACKNLEIGSVTIVTNWDHPTVRGYAGIKSKYYYVWGNSMRNELQTHHDIDPQYIKKVGSLLFDLYSHPDYLKSQDYLNFKSKLPISDKYVLIITNSPTFQYNLKIIKFIRNNLEKDIQIIIRLHPSFLHKPYKERIENHIRYNEHNDNVIYFFPQLNDSLIPTDMSYEEMQLSSSLVANAQVVISTMSTMILDGIISKKKLINIAFDWEKDDWSILKLGLLKNRIHLNRILDNKLMYCAQNRTELIALIKSFINEASNSNGKYLNIDHTIKAECGPIDGKGNWRIISMINKAAKMVGNA